MNIELARLRTVLALAALSLGIVSCGGGGSPTAPSLSAPGGLVATAGTRQVSLTWNAVAGATSYRVLRGGSQIAEVATTTYTDSGVTGGVQSCYTVRAVEGTRVSADSAQACATPLPDYSGAWSGTTSQGNSVSFSATTSTVKNFKITGEARGGGCTVTQTTTFTSSFSITGGSFQISSSEWQIQGTFSSESAVSGTANFTTRSGFCAGLGASFTWTAARH